MDSFQGKKQKPEEVTGVSRSGRVRKKSSKLMDFESPDDIERSFNKRQTTQSRKSEHFEPARKVSRTDESEHGYDNYEMPPSDSEYESDYELPANTESSMDSVGSDSDYEEHDVSGGGFKRLDTDSSKRRLIIKDGRIVRTDKTDSSPTKFKPMLAGKTNTTKTIIKKNLNNKTSPVSISMESSSISPPSPRGKDGSYKGTGIKPIDVAAHLKLLGESLTIIGERLKEHEGQIAVSGSLSVLLDSLLCALGPLLCLSQQIPELQENCCIPEQLSNTLDNVAFIMPGL